MRRIVAGLGAVAVGIAHVKRKLGAGLRQRHAWAAHFAELGVALTLAALVGNANLVHLLLADQVQQPLVRLQEVEVATRPLPRRLVQLVVPGLGQ